MFSVFFLFLLVHRKLCITENFELTFRYIGNSLECYLSVWAELQLKLNEIFRGFNLLFPGEYWYDMFI